MASPTGALRYLSAPSISDFEVQRLPSQSGLTTRRIPSRRDELQPYVDNHPHGLRDSMSRILAAKARPFSISGRIPFELSSLVLFFRSMNGVSYSLDFPIDYEHHNPPTLEALITACIPNGQGGSLVYPPALPLTLTLELSDHPIMDAVRNALFPLLPNGHYLAAMRDKLVINLSGTGIPPQIPSTHNDGRVATIQITLPVRFRGGDLVIRDPDGSEERYTGQGGKAVDLEWTAFLADCEYAVETVHKGCKLSISYGVYPRTFGAQVDPLIIPSDNFLDLFSPILNANRGRKIAFYLSQEYGVDPSEALAESLVPYLKGGDSVLYHSLKHYKLTPELHWTAGGYIWPVDRTIECIRDIASFATHKPHGHFVSPYGTDLQAEEAQRMRHWVESSGAIPLSQVDLILLTDWNALWPVGRERVPIVSGGELEKLVVNILLVAFIP